MLTIKLLLRKRVMFENEGEMGTNHTNFKKIAETVSENDHLVVMSEYDVVIR